MKHVVVVGCLTLLLGCNARDSADRTTIRFWHFWSEPAQRAALQDLVADFERHHPTIDVELTELQWGDGKAKLQLAFNAGTAPDVIHLGGDWFAEFDASGVIANLPDSLAVRGRAAWWVVNVRALVENTIVTDGSVGLCANDAHNVIKRDLPWLWTHGSPLATRTPVSSDLNDSLVDVLWQLHGDLMPHAVIDQARKLDERLLNGTLQRVYTGPWIVDMAIDRSVTSLKVVPTPSILNADVLAISARSAHAPAAHALIAWLCDYPQARRLCTTVSDAGFPSDLDRASTDTAFTTDPLRNGFLQTAKLSRPLPHSTRMLSIEPELENMFVRWYDVTSRGDVARIVDEAHNKVRAIESR